MSRRRAAIWLATLVVGLGILAASGASAARESIKADDLKEWLSYIASDELQGRATYSAGLDLAAAWVTHDGLHVAQLVSTLARTRADRWQDLRTEYAGPLPYAPWVQQTSIPCFSC